MMGSSVGNQEVGPSDRILAPSKRVRRARNIASCSSISLVSTAKRQRPQIVLAIVAFLLSSTVAQHEGSSIASHQTPPGTREVSSASFVFQHSTEAWQMVDQDLQNPSTEGHSDLLALGINLNTRNSVADPEGTTVPVHVASTSWDPSKASGLLRSTFPVDKNSLEVLDLATSSLGGVLAKTGTSLDVSSKGLRESTVATSVLKSMEKGTPGLFPTISPTSPLLPDAGSSPHLDVTPALPMTVAHPSRDAAPNTASSIAQPTASTVSTSPKPPAPEGSPQGEQSLTGTSQPLTKISHQTLLDRKSTHHGGDILSSTEMVLLTHQAVEEAPTSPEMLGTSFSSPPVPVGMVPSEATHVPTDVFHSSSAATTHSPWESTLHVFTGMHSGSLPSASTNTSSRSIALHQETVLNGKGPGGTESTTRDPLESTAVPPNLDATTALPTSADGVPVTTEMDPEVPLSVTSQLEESETRYGVSEGMVPSVHELATVSALTGQQTLRDFSTPQDFPRSEAISEFPTGNASLPVSQAPRTDSVTSSGTVGQLELGTTTPSPHSYPAGIPRVHHTLSTILLELWTVAADNPTKAVQSTTLGDSSMSSSSTTWSHLSASLGTTEGQEGFPTTEAIPTPSPDERMGLVNITSLGSTSRVHLPASLGTTEGQEAFPTTKVIPSPSPDEGTGLENNTSLGSTSSVHLPASLDTTEGQEGFPTTTAIPSPSPDERTGLENSTSLGSTSSVHLPASLDTTEGQEGFPTTTAVPSPSPDEGTGLENSTSLGSTSSVHLPASLGTTEGQEAFPITTAIPSPSPDERTGLENSTSLGSTSSVHLPASLDTTENQEGFSTTRAIPSLSPDERTDLENSTSLGSTSRVHLPASPGTTEGQEGFPTTTAIPSPSPDEGTGLEKSTSLGSISWVQLPASLGTTEGQEGFPTTKAIPSSSPDERTSLEWKEWISPTLELSIGVLGQVSISDGQSEPTSLDVSSTFLPTHASSLPTFSMGHSRGAGSGYSISFLPSSSTSEAVPSADVTELGSYRGQLQLKDHDETGQVTAETGKMSDSTSDLPLATSGAALSTDSFSSLTSVMLGVPPAWEHFASPGKRTESTSSPPSSSTFLTTSRITSSKESSQPATEESGSASESASTTSSNATLSSQFLDITGVAQSFWTTVGGMQPVGMVTGSPTASTGRELFSRTASEGSHPILTLSQAATNRLEVLDTSTAVDTSVFFVHSTSYRASSKSFADLSLVETKPTVTSHPKPTQAIFLLSNTTAPLASSRILPTTSVSTTSSACSEVHCLNNDHMASFAPLPRTSAQLPTTSPTLPRKVLVTTLGSAVGKKGTTAGLSTKVDTPTVTHTRVTSTTELNSMKLRTITRGGPTSEQLMSAPETSVVGQTTERHNFTLSKRTQDVCILPLEFHIVRIAYTESLGNKSSARYKKLEREVTLILNKMLSFYESFLQANVLRFLDGSVIAQSEVVFRGDGFVPTPSDMIRTIVTAVGRRDMDAFFDWRVDLKSLHCNGFSLKNLDPEVLAISFTVLGQGSIAAFGGLTDWGPLESQKNEVVLSLGARYRVRNFSLVQVRNVQGDLDISGEVYVTTDAHVDIDWALEALKGLANYSVDLGSVCINGSRLRLQIFQVSFLVTNRIFSEKLLDRSSMAHQSLSWDISKALMHTLGQYKNLLQVTIREVRGGSLICHADMIFQPPAPTSKDLVHTLALSVGPKNYLGVSGIQVDPFSFTVAGAKLEPPFTNPRIPAYGIALIVLSCVVVILMPFSVLLYKWLGRRGKMVIHRGRDPEVMVETFELDNPGFRSLAEANSRQSYSPKEVLG